MSNIQIKNPSIESKNIVTINDNLRKIESAEGTPRYSSQSSPLGQLFQHKDICHYLLQNFVSFSDLKDNICFINKALFEIVMGTGRLLSTLTIANLQSNNTAIPRGSLKIISKPCISESLYGKYFIGSRATYNNALKAMISYNYYDELKTVNSIIVNEICFLIRYIKDSANSPITQNLKCLDVSNSSWFYLESVEIIAAFHELINLLIQYKHIKLTALYCPTFGANQTTALPQDLDITFLHCAGIKETTLDLSTQRTLRTLEIRRFCKSALLFSEDNQIKHFSCNSLGVNTTNDCLLDLSKLQHLETLSFKNIGEKVKIVLPEKLPVLKSLVFNADKTKNPSVLEQFKGLQKEINSRLNRENDSVGEMHSI